MCLSACESVHPIRRGGDDVSLYCVKLLLATPCNLYSPGESVSSELGPTILSYSRQIAMGLMYLAFKKYIHRDIAARNVLISSEGVCKVS